MNTKQIVRVLYLAYSAYVVMVVGSTTLTFSDVLPAVLILWLNYAFFGLGYSYRREDNGQTAQTRSYLINCRRTTLGAMVVLSILCSVMAAQYYTGQTPVTVFRSIMGRVSLYNGYQRHFRESVSGTALIARVPYILMAFYVKFLLFFSYSSELVSPRRLHRFHRVCLTLSAVSYLYFGVARGTSYEVFEIALLGIFVGLTRRIGERRKRWRVSTVCSVTLIAITALMFFNAGIKARGITFHPMISRDVSYDREGLLSVLCPSVAFLVARIYDYFGFGFYYVSMYVKEIWGRDLTSFSAGLLPFGMKTLGVSDIREQMRAVVDMGARWHPDVALLMWNLGFLGLSVFCFLLGMMAKYVRTVPNGGPATFVTSFLIVEEMLSLPVGNFITASSSSQLIVLSIVVFWLWMRARQGIRSRQATG